MNKQTIWLAGDPSQLKETIVAKKALERLGYKVYIPSSDKRPQAEILADIPSKCYSVFVLNSYRNHKPTVEIVMSVHTYNLKNFDIIDVLAENLHGWYWAEHDAIANGFHPEPKQKDFPLPSSSPYTYSYMGTV